MVSSSEPSSDKTMMQCDDCGRLFPKSALKRCHKCGRVVCPECQKIHVCPSKKEWKRETASEHGSSEYFTCDYCHHSFPEEFMRRCRNCGVLLCPDCLKTHDCRWQPPNRDEAVPLHKPSNESFSIPFDVYQNSKTQSYPNSTSKTVLDPNGYQGEDSDTTSKDYSNPGYQPNQIPIYHEVVHEVPVYHEIIREVPSYPHSGCGAQQQYEEVIQKPSHDSTKRYETKRSSPGKKRLKIILILLLVLCLLVLFALMVADQIIQIPS